MELGTPVQEKTPPNILKKPASNAVAVTQEDPGPSGCKKLCRWIPSNFWEEAKKILVLAGPLVRATVYDS